MVWWFDSLIVLVGWQFWFDSLVGWQLRPLSLSLSLSPRLWLNASLTDSSPTIVQKYKYKYTNTPTQIQIHKYKDTILSDFTTIDLDIWLVGTVQKVEAVWEMCEGHIVKIYEGFQWQQCGSSHKVSDIGSGGFCFAVFSPHARPGWSHYNIIVPSHGSYSLQSNLLYIKILCWKFQNQQKFFSTIRCSIPHLEHYLTHPEIHPSHTQFLLSRRWAYRSDLSSLKREDDLILCQQISYEKAGWYNLCPAVKSINHSIREARIRRCETALSPECDDTQHFKWFQYRYFFPVPNIFNTDTNTFSTWVTGLLQLEPPKDTSKQFQHSLGWEEQKQTIYLHSAKDRNPESNWWRSHVEARGAGAPCERLL